MAFLFLALKYIQAWDLVFSAFAVLHLQMLYIHNRKPQFTLAHHIPECAQTAKTFSYLHLGAVWMHPQQLPDISMEKALVFYITTWLPVLLCYRHSTQRNISKQTLPPCCQGRLWTFVDIHLSLVSRLKDISLSFVRPHPIMIPSELLPVHHTVY